MALIHREKQAGIYYDKGGAVFNVLHPDYGASPTASAAANVAAIQAAMADAAGVGTVLIPPVGTFSVNSSLAPPSNTHLVIDGTLQTTTRLDYLFSATSQSNIHISGRGKVKGSNTIGGPTDEERLFWFITCSDVSIKDIELSQVTIGAQFQACTDWDFNCRVRDINARSDGSEGYGILANLENHRWRIGGRFYNIGRHAIYTGAGASDGVIDDVVVDTCVNTAVTCNCFDTQTRMKNIVYGSIVLKNVGTGALTSQCSGLSLFGNMENITITSGVEMDTVGQDGIRIEGTSTYLPTTNPQGITIDSPSINNCGGSGIVIVNAANVTLIKPRIRNATATGIIITVTGTGTGSFTDSVDLGSYDIDGAATGITISGDTRTTNVSLGWGQMRHVSGVKFNIPSTNTTVRYVGPTTVFDYTESALALSQTDNPFVANVVAAYWVPSEAGYITELFGRFTGAFTAGVITIKLSLNGASVATLQVTPAVGDLGFSAKVPIGAIAVAGGTAPTLIGVMYTSDASLAPSGSRAAIANVRFAPFPAAT